MNPKRVCFYCFLILVILWTFNIGGCSTQTVNPPGPPIVPEFARVPHPIGTDQGDLTAIFLEEKAPKDPEFVKTCDANFRKLKELTASESEIAEGVRELVKREPVHYHWCFYAKILNLEKVIRADTYVDERQKEVLDTFVFLVPIARSFSSQFHDSRYLRWAVDRYRKYSEMVFFRKMDLTPMGTLELVQPVNPFGLYRNSTEGFSVLDKYHLVEPGTPVVTPLRPGAEPSQLPPDSPDSPDYSPVPESSALPSPVPYQAPEKTAPGPKASPASPIVAPSPLVSYDALRPAPSPATVYEAPVATSIETSVRAPSPSPTEEMTTPTPNPLVPRGVPAVSPSSAVGPALPNSTPVQIR